MTPPNILWVCTDQQRYDTIGALGYSHVDTPHVDRLVAEGVAFYARLLPKARFVRRAARVFPHWPVRQCRPHQRQWPRQFSPTTRRWSRETLAEAGYDCGLIGKLHLASAYGRIEPRVNDGYRYWEYSHAPRDDWPQGHGYADWVREKGGSP